MVDVSLDTSCVSLTSKILSMYSKYILHLFHSLYYSTIKLLFFLTGLLSYPHSSLCLNLAFLSTSLLQPAFHTVTKDIILRQWFSTGRNFACLGTFSNVWGLFWLTQHQSCYWHWAGRGQGCCKDPIVSYASPSTTKNCLTWSANSSVTEKRL